MITGLGQPQPKPFIRTGNDLFDRMQQGDFSEPAAQRVLASVQPKPEQPASPQPIGALGGPSGAMDQPKPEAQPMNPIAAPTNVRGLGSPSEHPDGFNLSMPSPMATAPIPATPAQSPAETPHVAELNRVTAPPLPAEIPRFGPEGEFKRMQHNPLANTKADTGRSGIGQIHNPVLRHGLGILDAIGSAFLPNLTAMIPGTELHHRDVVDQAAANVAGDTARAKSESDTRLNDAQAENQLSQATERGEAPGDPTKTIEVNGRVMQFNQGTQKYDIDAGAAPGKFSTQHAIADDGSVWAITTNLGDGTRTQEMIYQGDPNVQTDLTEVQVNGKPHRVLVNSKTGETVKDLGEVWKAPESDALDRIVPLQGADGRTIGVWNPRKNTIVRPPIDEDVYGHAPQQIPAAVQQELRGADLVLSITNELVGSDGKPGRLQQVQSKLGPVWGRIAGLQLDKLGGAGLSPEESENLIWLKRMLLSTAFADGGKQLTGLEKDIVMNNIPQASDTLQTALNKAQITHQVMTQKKQFAIQYLTPEQKRRVLNAGHGGSDQPQAGSIQTITTKEQYDALPKGAEYMEDGKKYRKP